MSFKRGDFVRLKEGEAGRVGVVWQIDLKSLASIGVYWRGESETSRMQQAHEPSDLQLVPREVVPEYAMDLKWSLGL